MHIKIVASILLLALAVTEAMDPILLYMDGQSSTKYYKVPVKAGSYLYTSVIKETCEQHGMKPQCYHIDYSNKNCVMKPSYYPNASEKVAKILCGTKPLSCPPLNHIFWFMRHWHSGSAWGINQGKFVDGKYIRTTNDNQYFAACLSGHGTGDGWKFTPNTVRSLTTRKEVFDHTKCCAKCKEDAPDTQMYNFNKKEKKCYCRQPHLGVTPTTEKNSNNAAEYCPVNVETGDGWKFVNTHLENLPTIAASDHTKCCAKCKEDAPDTQMYNFNKKDRKCYCRKTNPGFAPTTEQKDGTVAEFCT